MNKTFPQWILKQMESREWSQADLARHAGLSRTAISDVISGKAKPGFNLCLAVGKAFEMPAESIFRVAGLLPARPEIDEEIEQILHEAAKLSKPEQEELLAFIRMKRKLRKKGK